MKIIEKDLKVEIDDQIFILHTLKSKKELKENSEDSYKIAGYSNNFGGLLKSVIKFRTGKKYPFKESAIPIQELYKEYRKTLTSLSSIISTIEMPITTLKQTILNGNRKI